MSSDFKKNSHDDFSDIFRLVEFPFAVCLLFLCC